MQESIYIVFQRTIERGAFDVAILYAGYSMYDALNLAEGYAEDFECRQVGEYERLWRRENTKSLMEIELVEVEAGAPMFRYVANFGEKEE